MAFHLWNTRHLARELADNTLTERDGFLYALSSALVYAAMSYSNMYFSSDRNWLYYAEFVLVVAISGIGVYECFKANGDERGHHFLMRFSALAVPIGLKVGLLYWLATLSIYWLFPFVAYGGVFRSPEHVWRYIFLVLSLSTTVLYFWRIAHFLRLIRAREERAG